MDAYKEEPFEVVESPEPEVVPFTMTMTFVAADVEDDE
ncbi:hypothetical protein FHR84_000607 [Actinopolyspora biskrensis]|uniref:Uncharacterized protein n=1 Tax=Actinopolyspora biskrensis TaxID=1470178 RepID=A0A852Z4W2_9ACTN|nr:hypothetical protein [Actinopolyspora biskrensis]